MSSTSRADRLEVAVLGTGIMGSGREDVSAARLALASR